VPHSSHSRDSLVHMTYSSKLKYVQKVKPPSSKMTSKTSCNITRCFFW